MKRLILASLLFATPALAQQHPDPVIQTLDMLLHQATEREAIATISAAQLQAQLEAVTKERDALKATTTKPAHPAHATTAK